MLKNKISKTKTIGEIKRYFELSGTDYDSRHILEMANKEREGKKSVNAYTLTQDTYVFKAMTLLEFDHSILLANSVPDLFRSFVVEFFRSLLKEFDCKTVSEKSLAETVALNFVRILETQRKIKDNQTNVQTKYDIQYIAILSKELDRAERHYTTSLNELRSMRMPKLSMSIKTNTAVVGSNQIVQVRDS